MSHHLLEGKKGIIFGALNSHSIAWKVAEKAHEEGARFVLSNMPVSIRMGEINELAEKCDAKLIAADATNYEDLEKLFSETMEHFGGKIDFILHSIGMSVNVRKKITYDKLNYDYYMRTLDASAVSFHKMLQVANNMDAINEWGSVIALSYIAAQRAMYGYNDMADAKALLESISRSFGYILGREKKISVNTISQSPTQTSASTVIHGFNSLTDFSDRMSPLGNANAEECANFCIALFSDLTKKITMQTLYHDGGFSNMGMSHKAIEQYEKSFDGCDCEEKKDSAN
ncbi:MAG: SDR family oxidoreductase [Bacteroidota bacterium]